MHFCVARMTLNPSLRSIFAAIKEAIPGSVEIGDATSKAFDPQGLCPSLSHLACGSTVRRFYCHGCHQGSFESQWPLVSIPHVLWETTKGILGSTQRLGEKH